MDLSTDVVLSSCNLNLKAEIPRNFTTLKSWQSFYKKGQAGWSGISSYVRYSVGTLNGIKFHLISKRLI